MGQIDRLVEIIAEPDVVERVAMAIALADRWTVVADNDWQRGERANIWRTRWKDEDENWSHEGHDYTQRGRDHYRTLARVAICAIKESR